MGHGSDSGGSAGKQLSDSVRCSTSANADDSVGIIANLTHELKTPLHSILAVAGLLRAQADGPLTPEQEKQVEIIVRNGEDLLGLIVNLLDYSTAASSRQPRYEFLALKETLDRYIEALRSVAGQNQATLRAELIKAPDRFACDPFYLRQIVNNLLSNAVKFSKGAVVILAAELQADSSLRLQVVDSGIGMPADVRDSIFEEFFQGDSGDSRSFGGVGLGLSLVKKSVEMLDGTIEVQSEVGKGTIFTVNLPAANHKVPEYRLLIVEPDTGVRLSLEEIFRKEGYLVSSNRKLSELIGCMADFRPHLVLLDLGEQTNKVFDTVKSIRGASWGLHLPIVLMSVFDGPKERAASFACGATDFVAKPFDVSEVAARVRMHLKKR